MKKITIGILAHVDAGKTTLTESLLYLSGKIRKQGRVDHGDAYLDYDDQERQRGITIFSKQAMFTWENTEIILLDTPGHVDFSSEMERTLQVLDYAIIVVSGIDGIQSHTQTIWKLLDYYHIPTFIFVNKMDITHQAKEELFKELTTKLSYQCINFSSQDFYENIAFCDDELLEEYENTLSLSVESIQKHISLRHIFPCFFGSALKLNHIEQLLNALDQWTKQANYHHDFAAKIYKITRDEQGNRLTHLKITGGHLKVKDVIENQKVDQIRIYSGKKYEVVNEVEAGDVCAIKGFMTFQAGQCLGEEKNMYQPILSSYMNYRMILPDDIDYYWMIQNLKQLAEENPELHIEYKEESRDIHVQFMGEVQIEILKSIIQSRFGVDVEFGQGQMIYHETIQDVVEGVGHFEPLRHYSEVHVLLEPLERGSGVKIDNQCPIDMLDKHYQRLILSHLQEKQHRGVLTGSTITDIKITLLAGKAHLKHTEGGDFREATYRAVRQGLKKAKSLLLEPYYQFECHVPISYMSRIMFDIENMKGTCCIDYQDQTKVILKGEAPVRTMQNYQLTITSLTKGEGKLYCSIKGYEVCEDQDEIVASMGYDSESDVHNPTGSIFCKHGAGFYVPYNHVEDYMHIPYQMKKPSKVYTNEKYSSDLVGDKELEAIFEKTYGKTKRKLYHDYYKVQDEKQASMVVKAKPECLLVDGYNVIHAWEGLKELARDHLDIARDRLIDIMSNYQGYRKCLLIVVFDAYKVKQNLGTIEKHHNIYVVYTKEAQTADMYIERTTHDLSVDYNVVVATSDALEQLIVSGRGARRMSSRELQKEVESITSSKLQEFQRKQPQNRNFLLEDIKEYKKMEE